MTLEIINKIPYGYGFMGSNKTFKARYKAQHADLIMQRIPKQHHVLFITYKTQKDMKFIGLMAHHSHIIWIMFERAVIQARGELLTKTN